MAEIDPYVPPSQVGLAEPERVVGDGLRNPRALAIWTIGLLVLALLVDFATHLWATLAWSPQAEDLAGLISLPVHIAYFVVFLCWTYRVLWNAHRMSSELMTVSPGWGVGSYFVPIVNFWIPVKALLQASRVCGTSQGLVLMRWIGGFAVVGLYIGYVILFFDEQEFGMSLADHAVVFSDVIFVVLEILIILGLTRSQQSLAKV
ncbi:MAG: DUF4328 domain-containing protein [Verrucomicrobiota bacterium]